MYSSRTKLVAYKKKGGVDGITVRVKVWDRVRVKVWIKVLWFRVGVRVTPTS